MKPRRAAFLDRDGVINLDRGYVYRREDFEFVPGVLEGARRLGDHGASVAHNPGSNMRLGNGLADMRGMLERRVNVGIGTGWQREEFSAVGLDFDRAWTLLDDGVRAMQLLWREMTGQRSSPGG